MLSLGEEDERGNLGLELALLGDCKRNILLMPWVTLYANKK